MISIKLLGSTTIKVDGEERTTSDLGGTRPRQILEMLAVDLGSPVPKDRLAEALWEGTPPATYRATVESYVCVLRRGLGIDGGRTSALGTTHRGYVLDAARAQVDLVEVRRLLRNASTGPRRQAVENALQALAMITGELLVDEAYAAWAERERESLARLLTQACTDAATVANDGGDLDAAIRLARTATEQGVLAEAAWQALMTGLWRSGREAEALAAYADLRYRTLDELGVEPGRVSEALYLAILRQDGRQADRSTGLEVATLLRLLRQALAHETEVNHAFGPRRDEPSSAGV